MIADNSKNPEFKKIKDHTPRPDFTITNKIVPASSKTTADTLEQKSMMNKVYHEFPAHFVQLYFLS
ncbi:MAG: hypothetical protein ABI405_07865 [Parafilimonas sp.]